MIAAGSPGPGLFGTGSSEGSDDPPQPPRLLGDEAELFQSFHGLLTRIVQSLVNRSPEIVDDACNYAWMWSSRATTAAKHRAFFRFR